MLGNESTVNMCVTKQKEMDFSSLRTSDESAHHGMNDFMEKNWMINHKGKEHMCLDAHMKNSHYTTPDMAVRCFKNIHLTWYFNIYADLC